MRAPDDLSVEQPTDDGPLAGAPAADEAQKRSATSRMAARYMLTLAIGLSSGLDSAVPTQKNCAPTARANGG